MTNIMRHPSDGRSRYPAAADAKRPACASRPDQKAHEARAAAGVTSSRSNDAGTGMEPIPTPQTKRSAISMTIENGRAADSSEVVATSRSEERRVGKEGDSTGRSRGSP